MSSTFGIIGTFITFLHLVAMVALGGLAFGLIKISAFSGLEKLKISGYGLAAIAVTTLLGTALNFIITTFLGSVVGYEAIGYWHMARGVIGNGIDILGFGAATYGAIAAAKE